jgi:hypothetical protein
VLSLDYHGSVLFKSQEGRSSCLYCEHIHSPENRICTVCNKRFVGTHRSLYCSTRCKGRAERARRKEQGQAVL